MNAKEEEVEERYVVREKSRRCEVFIGAESEMIGRKEKRGKEEKRKESGFELQVN